MSGPEPIVQIFRDEKSPIVAVDGAYCGVALDISRLLFYEDQVHPKFAPTKPDNVDLDNKIRRIKFEIRIPTKTLVMMCGSILLMWKMKVGLSNVSGEKMEDISWAIAEDQELTSERLDYIEVALNNPELRKKIHEGFDLFMEQYRGEGDNDIE